MTHRSTQQGFAMLFTVLIVSLIMTIAISISNLTLRQAVLSNLAKDSQIAFAEADAAIECALYEDTVLGNFPIGSTVPNGSVNIATDVEAQLYCGDTLMELDTTESYPEYFVYEISGGAFVANKPCFSIIFDKTNPLFSRVEGRGYNICGSSNRRVERALEVKY